MKHLLKIESKYFDDINDGAKRFEIRFNDRDYKLHDTLVLREIDERGEYTTRKTRQRIIYTQTKFCADGYICLGLDFI